MSDRLKVLFLASEAAPFIKVGGLGDVAGALPLALRSLPDPLDIRLVLPLHAQIDQTAYDLKPVAALTITHNNGPITAEVFETQIEGVPIYLIASEAFANAHGLEPGDRVSALINGRRRDLRIVGLGLSPEYVYIIPPGELIPDDHRFGIFWMERRALGAAFDMEGGFNDVSLQVMPGASVRLPTTTCLNSSRASPIGCESRLRTTRDRAC